MFLPVLNKKALMIGAIPLSLRLFLSFIFNLGVK